MRMPMKMKKIFKSKLTMCIITGFLSHNSLAAVNFYDANTRTISVRFEQPVESATVYLAGENMFGRCIPARSLVYTMNYIHDAKNSNTTKAELASGLNARAKIVDAKIGTSYSREYGYTQHIQQRFFITLGGLAVRRLHYNIVYQRNGKRYSLGWQPDNGGGCTYNVL